MVVEDGTGLLDSNSYVSLEYADDYFSSHGFNKWEELTESEKEVLMVNATDYVDNIFDWKGIKETQEQSLAFPRSNLYTKDGYLVEGVPKQLKDAVCEAIKQMISNQTLFKTSNENGAVTSERIGELSFTYDVSQKTENATLYEAINSRLKGLYNDSTKKKILSAQVRRKL